MSNPHRDHEPRMSGTLIAYSRCALLAELLAVALSGKRPDCRTGWADHAVRLAFHCKGADPLVLVIAAYDEQTVPCLPKRVEEMSGLSGLVWVLPDDVDTPSAPFREQRRIALSMGCSAIAAAVDSLVPGNLPQPHMSRAEASQNLGGFSRPRRTLSTRREMEIVRLLAQGYSVKECAEALGRSVHTIDNQKTRIMRKAGAHKTIELVRLAFRLGLIEI